MTKSFRARIIEDRRLKQNPYAHSDGQGDYSALPPIEIQPDASSEQVHRSRLKLQNPWAHHDGDGGYSALTGEKSTTHDSFAVAMPLDVVPIGEFNPRSKEHYSDDEIELIARNLQTKIWQERNKIWSGIAPSNPIKILDPEIALKLIGFDFELAESLGQFFHEGKQVEVAGTIDKDSNHVHISRKFHPYIRSFTAAHELGHALMHKSTGLHRDRPVDGTSLSRTAIERQADKFATYFLMPQKQMKVVFKQLFLADKFILSEATAFALGCNYESLEKMTLRQLSRVLASAERFNGINFISLAEQFHVSIETMAIRIEELGLIEEL